MTSTTFPSLVVLSGAEPGTALNLDEVLNGFSIGADEGCNLVLNGGAVSPAHASIFLDDEGRVTLTDTNSRAGVFVNGLQILEQVLDDGDEISIGPPDDSGSARLRYAAQGSQPLLDLADLLVESPVPLEEFEPVAETPQLLTTELGRPAFAGAPDPASIELLPDVDLNAVDEFRAPEMLPDMFAAPEAVDVPVAEPEPPPPVAAVESPSVRAAAPKPVVPSGSKPGPVASRPTTTPVPKKLTTQKIGSASSDDPLSGLAESLGVTRERIEPPPAMVDAPIKGAKGQGRSPALVAARLAVIAAALVAVAWFGLKKYSQSIVAPIVDAFQPNPAEPGQAVSISGSGFGTESDSTSVKVMVGEVEAQVIEARPTRISLVIPESLGASGSQTVSLKVAALGSISTGRLIKLVVVPKISALTPRVALAGDEVSIAGKWLSNSKLKPTVTVAGNEAEVLEAQPALIRIKIPEISAIEGKRVAVRVAVGPDVGKEALLNFGRLPFVETVSPERLLPGEVVTISGLGLLGPDLAVSFGGRSAAILSATEAELKVSAPGLSVSESAGARDLVVSANQKASVVRSIEILRESSATYSPRFFAEVRDGSRVAVSCELGPVMVLGADPLSRKRAHDAVVKLNALAQKARGSRVQFVAGDVVISAQGGAVLAVGPLDGSGNARSLASLWAAQLTDMFDLFFQGRRPGRTVELSPDGKVFLDMFSAARRRSSEPGVPPGLLFSPDPTWVRSLGALASAPSLGSGQALSLIDGFWAGVIEVPGAIQPRKVEISLTATPSGLVGQRTSRQGRLSTDVTLRNLDYSRRELRFSFVDSGENLSFVGRLDGDVIDGQVSRASGARVGRLILKLTR